jgi:predicted transcriptional regulator
MGLVQVLSGDFFSGIWTAFLGWFLNNAAEATRHMDLEAQRPLLVVPTDMRLSDALQLLGDEGFNEIWVTDEGRVVGLEDRRKFVQKHLHPPDGYVGSIVMSLMPNRHSLDQDLG